VTPETLLRVANLTVPRKPDREPTVFPNPLATTATAMEALGLRRLTRPELVKLRELHRAVVELTDAILDRRSPTASAAQLTRLASPSSATAQVEVGAKETMRVKLEWRDRSVVAALARRIVLELGELEPRRLKRCERVACNLLFYDTTRPGTKRWHAEVPCGIRERQRRHREVSHAGRGNRRDARNAPRARSKST
jgi:predicted RNA-binding Zn ribbon-like protein